MAGCLVGSVNLVGNDGLVKVRAVIATLASFDTTSPGSLTTFAEVT